MERKNRKQRTSFTLSPESLRYLEAVKKQRKSASVSAVLDEIILERMRVAHRAAIDAKVVAYYDSMSNEVAAESRDWGEMAERDFTTE